MDLKDELGGKGANLAEMAAVLGLPVPRGSPSPRRRAARSSAEAGPTPALQTILAWADDLRRGGLGGRANADNGPDAPNARRFGAEGIGL